MSKQDRKETIIVLTLLLILTILHDVLEIDIPEPKTETCKEEKK